MRTLYASGWVVTMDDAGTEHPQGWVLVEDGVIHSLGAGAEPDGADDAAERVELGGAVVTPGLVNTHHHLCQTLTRARAQQAQTPGEVAQAEGILGAALGRLLAVAEAYPELQADENFRQLQTELAETENRVAVSRQVYNDSVLTYHNAIQTFPGVVFAGPFGFNRREFFEVEEAGQREAPVVDF